MKAQLQTSVMHLLRPARSTAIVVLLALVAALPAVAGKSAKPVQVKLKPTSATLKVGDSKRFTAKVKNTGERGVSWSVDGVPGGSEMTGTVDARGMYRAPAWSGDGITVTVTATTDANPAIAASARVRVLPGGEPLEVRSVTPTAVESGAVSFAIAGVGFTTGCRATLGAIELQTALVSATELLATGHVPEGLAPEAALVVIDPGPPRRVSPPTKIAISLRPPPAITSVSPGSIHPGAATLTLTGSGFDGNSRVLLDTLELQTTLLSPFVLSASGVVPETMVPGASLVVVDATRPARRSAPFPLAIDLPPLVLGQVTPARVYAGPNRFEVQGSGFRPGTIASIGGIALATTVVSPTLLAAEGEVPDALAPQAPLLLVDGGAPDRRSAPFTIAIDRITPIVVGGVQPTAVYVGRVEFTITGTGFTPATGVQLGSLLLQTTFISDTLLFAAGTVPESMAPGAPLVLVEAGPPPRRSAPVAITVTPVPPILIESVTPMTVYPGKVIFTITGTGFDADTRAAVGTTPLATRLLSATTLEATGTIGESLAPGADLVLHDGGPPARDSAPVRITIERLEPIVLSQVYPATVPTGPASFTLEGTGFTPNSQAKLGNLALTTSFVSSTSLTATGTVPQTMVPRASMTVVESTPSQRQSNAMTVTIEYGVNTRVTIDPVEASMPAATGMKFTATLQGDPEHPFYWAVNGVPGGNETVGKVNGDGWYSAPAEPPTPSTVTITARSMTNPPATGQATVTITNPLPAIAGVFPLAVRPGPFTISIRGSGFLPTSRVLYDGAEIPASFVSSSRLEASGTASRGDGRRATVQVANPDPGGAVSQAVTISILSDPATTSYRASAEEAGRFLEQASFGPNAASLDRVRELGLEGWIDEQFDLPASTYPEPEEKCVDIDVRRAFTRHVLQGEDQLRQRLVFALGQIFVISANKTGEPEQLLIWQRMLSDHAFGNFRELLDAVTKSPTMGRYLDLANSSAAAPDGSSQPNENYPREVLQLFSIGLERLHPDGTPILDGAGEPIPTYDQDAIEGLARAMTGWGYPTPPGEKFRWPTRQNYSAPMQPYDPAHEFGEKLLLDGVVLPAGGTAESDMDAALDNIVQHPNVGPFIGTRLIRALVKSNPSPAYVARVTQAFDDNGRGVRGDLKAVVKAVLLDPEARSGEILPGGGKLREPVLHLVGVLRGLDGQLIPEAGLTATETREMSQRLLEPPSVFNYFSPLHQLEGGLFGPEFQIYTPITSTARENMVYRYLNESYRKEVTIDVEPYRALAGQPAELVDRIDETFFYGRMTEDLRSSLIRSLNAHTTDAKRRALTALYLALSSGEYLVQH